MEWQSYPRAHKAGVWKRNAGSNRAFVHEKIGLYTATPGKTSSRAKARKSGLLDESELSTHFQSRKINGL